jgi:altronate dehydratase
MVNVLRLHPEDNVVTALTDLAAGTRLEWTSMNGHQVCSSEAIPFGHKVAIAPIARGEHVIKYGASIGVAVQDICPGQHVHVHNLHSVRGAATS